MTRIHPLLALPPLLFAAFAVVAYLGLRRDDPDALPSALTGESAPSLERLAPLGDGEPPTDADLAAPGAKLVNFWASWCAPCRAEHPMLERLAAEGITIHGVNYKDAPEDALGFLAGLGDPFARVGADATGRTGLDWGLYGVPETFVIDGDGRVVMRHAGPITEQVLERRLRPAMADAE